MVHLEHSCELTGAPKSMHGNPRPQHHRLLPYVDVGVFKEVMEFDEVNSVGPNMTGVLTRRGDQDIDTQRDDHRGGRDRQLSMSQGETTWLKPRSWTSSLQTVRDKCLLLRLPSVCSVSRLPEPTSHSAFTHPGRTPTCPHGHPATAVLSFHTY